MSLPPLPAGLTLSSPASAAKDNQPPRRRDPRGAVRLRTGEQVVLPTLGARATGEAHDGDTFRLSDGRNARLYGVDAFELPQTARLRDGATLSIGQQARDRLVSMVSPEGVVRATGGQTYGRPVASLERDGTDAGRAILDDGLGIATPEYLRADPDRLGAYMEAERLARLNRRGAWSTQFEQPASFRHGTADPWAKPVEGKPGESEAVFWDEPLPFQGLRPEIADGYKAIWQDRSSTPADLLAYAKANGFSIDADVTRKAYAERDKGRPAGTDVTYKAPPRVLTDVGDGRLGSFARGLGDPLNVIDEAGALVDTLGGTAGRENIWNSDRRFGDVYANNLDQNRSILANDEATHPYYRLGGQLASGLAIPGASVEGVGLNAARTVLRGGGTRFAAEAAGKAAVRNRLIATGTLEGAAIGAGGGKTPGQRAASAVTGGITGGALGGVVGIVGPAALDFAGRVIPRSSAGGRRVVDFASQNMTAGARRAIRQRRGLDPITGQFGTIHYNLAAPKRWNKAVERLSADKSGEIPAAIHHPEIGNVDVIWGTDRYGLRHIAERHPEVVDELPRLVERLPVRQRPDEVGNNRYVLEDDTHRAVVAPDFDGQTKRWVVTAYEKKVPEEADISPRSPVPDGGSTGARTADDVGGASVAGNGARGSEVTDVAVSPQRMAADDPLRPVDRIDVNARARPVQDDATAMERTAQAERVQPSDMLPLPANTVGSLEEAEAIAAGRVAPVRAPNETDELSRRTVTSATTGAPLSKRGPLDLVTWLRTQGGIRAQGGELEQYGIDNSARQGMDFAGGENRFGPLVSNEGMTYDDAARAAWEAGYFPDRVERPTIGEFLDALNETHSGRSRAFRPDDLDEVDRFEAAREQRYAVEAARQEGRPLMSDRAQPVGPDDLDANAPPVSAYEEWGENAPQIAGNLRLDKLDSPQAISRALAETHRRVGGFDAATRGRITQAETERLAGELGMTADDLLARRKGQAFNAEEALAARQILARSATDLVNLSRRMQRVDEPGEELEAAFKQAWLRHVAIQEQVAGATAEAGRALSAFRMAADSRLAGGRVLPTLGDFAGGSGRLKDAADLIVENAANPAALNQATVRAIKPRFRDKLVELYYNSLLSGPQTHAVNILSNTLTALGQLPEHAVAAGVGAVRKALPSQAETDRVLFSELGARTVGLVQGTKEGMRQAARTFLTGEPADAVRRTL